MYTIIVAVRPGPATGDVPGYEYLMVRNRKRGGRWELPGGRGRPDEEPLACARREFREETGRVLVAPVEVQTRRGPDGGGHVFLARPGRSVAKPDAAEIEAVAFFSQLPNPSALSFPTDPYPEIFRSVVDALAEARTRVGAGRRGP